MRTATVGWGWDASPPRQTEPIETREGYVYGLSNVSMPGCYKVGRTAKCVHGRAIELSGATGVPTPFDVMLYSSVKDAKWAERLIHEALVEFRVSPQREFFRVPYPILRACFTYVTGLISFHEERPQEPGMQLFGMPADCYPNPHGVEPGVVRDYFEHSIRKWIYK